MKVIIAGSRDINDYNVVLNAVVACDFNIQEVVSGMARGVDTLAIRYAKDADVPLKEFPADWTTYGKAAGHIRNRKMAEYADALIAIWDGKSRGTINMIKQMQKLYKPVYVVCVE